LREEAFIAGTFVFAHEKPWTKAFYPYLLTDHFYDGKQEDATELLTQFLLTEDTAPTLHNLTKGTLVQNIVCPLCGEVCSQQFQPFHVLVVPTVGADGTNFTTVQQALDACWMPETIEVTNDCMQCQHHFTQAPSTLSVHAVPEVLYMTLSRWMHLGQPPTCHSLNPSMNVKINDVEYKFVSSIIHTGNSAEAGHYVAVAKHVAPTNAVWMYNDSRRTYAKPGEVNADGVLYPDGPVFKSYGIFFEKV
jgi:uncharacterized UBP type Zn finger protein